MEKGEGGWQRVAEAGRGGETLIPAAREPLKVQDQPGLHIEFEDSQG